MSCIIHQRRRDTAVWSGGGGQSPVSGVPGRWALTARCRAASRSERVAQTRPLSAKNAAIREMASLEARARRASRLGPAPSGVILISVCPHTAQDSRQNSPCDGY